MLVCGRLKHTVQALSSLHIHDSDINLTISMDRKCDAELIDFVSDFQKFCPERVFVLGQIEELGTGTLRNKVIKASEDRFGRGRYIYLSDNDVFFYPAIFEKMSPIYEYGRTLGFTVLGAYNHPFHHGINEYPVYGGGTHLISRIKEVQALALQSMLMSWDVWEKFGPFVDTPVGRVCMGEDIAFTNKIRDCGYKIGVVDPPLVVNTGLTNSFGDKIPGWEMVERECPKGIYCE